MTLHPTPTQCPVLYAGPTYPQFHGAQCDLLRGHHGRHHAVVTDDYSTGPITWWTPEQKEALYGHR